MGVRALHTDEMMLPACGTGRVNDILSQLRVMLRSPWPERGNALTLAFKHVVVFGGASCPFWLQIYWSVWLPSNVSLSAWCYVPEFNFRVEMPRHRAEALSAEANFEEVFLGDQLRMMREVTVCFRL